MKTLIPKKIRANQSLDVRGLSCPQPLVQAKKAMTLLEKGQVLEILGTCPGSKTSLPAWAKQTGNDYLGMIAGTDCYKFYLRRS